MQLLAGGLAPMNQYTTDGKLDLQYHEPSPMEVLNSWKDVKKGDIIYFYDPNSYNSIDFFLAEIKSLYKDSFLVKNCLSYRTDFEMKKIEYSMFFWKNRENIKWKKNRNFVICNFSKRK